MIKDWKNDPVEPLKILSYALRDPDLDWAGREELTQLRYTQENLDCSLALNLQLGDLLPLIEAYGSALTCQFLIRDQVILIVNQHINEDALNRFRQAITGYPTVSFYLKIDKSILVLDWFGQFFDKCQFPQQLFLYLYPEKLKYFLENCSLEQFEQKAYKDHWGDRIAFIIPSQEIFIIGPHLIVLGGKYLQNPPSSIYQDKRIKIEEHEQIIHQCQNTLKWQKPWITMMTPWHLFTAPESSVRDPIAKAVRIHFTNLFLLFTSDRTFEQGKGNADVRLLSRYSTSQQTLDIGFEKTDQFDIGVIPPENFEALLHIFEWSYDARWKASDRLPIVQIGVVEALKGANISKRYELLLENAPTISENITWHWKAFIEGKIDAYLDQIQSLEEQVGKTVNSYSEQISSIIARLTETMLAAVGVVLGSFIAALFQEKFNPVVFRIGLVTYALYVIFFPLLYNMKHRWESVEMLEKEFDTQKGWFEKRIPPDRVNSIIDQSQIKQNKERFKRWFGWTIAIYLLVFVLSLLAAWLIPQWKITAAMPLVTPASTLFPTVGPTAIATITLIP